jgi:selenocysteine lyase/cysteine desulfurase
LRGPKGIGVLYVSDRALGRLAPAQSNDMPDARRFEGHEFNPGLHLAFKAACDYAHAIGPARIQRRNRHVRAMVASSLAARVGWVALEAEHPDRSALMTYRMDERTIPADTLVSRLWRAGINASCIGAQQAPWASEATGATTLLRLTPHYITSDEEIDRLARAIEDAMTLP